MNTKFLSNGEPIDLSRLKSGLGISISNLFLQQYDKNKNSIFEKEEIESLKRDLEAKDVNGDGQIDRAEAISWASALGIAQGKINELFKENNNAVDEALKILVSEQTKADAAATITRDADNALAIYFKAENESGEVAKEWNNFKQLSNLVFDVKYAGNKVYRQLINKKVIGVLLEEAQKGGLTRADYINIKIGLLINLLGANGMSQKERDKIKQSILNMELSEIETLIEKLCNAEDGEYQNVAKQECDNLINLSDRKKLSSDKTGMSKIKTPVKAILESALAKKNITFEQVFKMEMGIDFNEQAVRDYAQKEQELQILAVINNRVAATNKKLSQAVEFAKLHVENSRQSGLPTNPEEYIVLNKTVLSALKEIFGNNEQRIEEEIKLLLGYGVKIKDGLIDFGRENYSALIELAEKLQGSLTSRLKNMLGGKTIEQYQQELKNSYAVAYGLKNPVDLAQGYAQDQKDGVMYAKFGAQALGFGMMLISGGSLMAVGAGMLTATGGSIGISAFEAVTKEGGATEEDKAAIREELITAIKLLPAGFGVGMAATKIGAQFTSRVAQLVGNYGSDLVMSILVDMTIMGDVNLSAEGVSELMNIFMGIAAHSKIRGRGKTGGTVKPEQEPRNPLNNQHNADKICNELKLTDIDRAIIENLKDGESHIIKGPDNTEIVVTKNGSEYDVEVRIIKNQDTQGFGARGVNITDPMEVRLGRMQKGTDYNVNPDRLPLLDIGGESIDLNTPEYARMIYALREGQSITVGREGDILTNPNNDVASRRHVLIFRQNGQIKIRDISTNGTGVISDARNSYIVQGATGNMNRMQSYEINPNSLPIIELPGNIRVNLKDYAARINSLMDGQSFTIGREGDVRIYGNDAISRQHILVYKSNGILKIKNLSVNRTRIVENGFITRIKNKINSTINDLLPSSKIERLKLTENQSRILSAFKDHPTIKKLGGNSSQLIKLLNNIENIIKNPRYVSPEVRDAVLNGKSRLNTPRDNTLVNCEIDKNMMNDIVKMANGEDYINKFSAGASKNEIMSKTPVGEVASVGGRLYVNNGTTLEPINMSESTFRKLFPPISRFSTHQGAIGTCYLVSVLERMYTSPKGRVELYRMIGEDSNGIYTITANGKGKKTYFRRFDSHNMHIEEENGLAIIEQGWCKNSVNGAKEFNPRETRIMNLNDGGLAEWSIEGLLGVKPTVSYDRESIRRYIMQYANNENIIINIGTKSQGFTDDTHFLSKEYNIYTRHEYSIKGYDGSTDSVILCNPHHSGVVVKIPMEEFLKYISQLSIIRL